MIEAKIYERPDRNYAKVIILSDGIDVYDFKEKRWIEVKNYAELSEDCQLLLSPESYAAIAKVMEEDKTLPKTQLSFVEGKLEATEKHLDDMRKLVFEERNQ